ncbi:hypothetical protein HYPSUDRAFT_198264 [Hypholoma sublateritium FD-334 SS-4]|uniref:Uncharacterized protein n=1 Tax=Hypholoma sublateritium (strain FD-334 SS-4) TaxID=945553 RepID=A0A0D2LIR0_HYPSF|nr:hypothetical protein HYPSUDRAFT_198264 [Hypholoma sublateritium FD-334 SS-4]
MRTDLGNKRLSHKYDISAARRRAHDRVRPPPALSVPRARLRSGVMIFTSPHRLRPLSPATAATSLPYSVCRSAINIRLYIVPPTPDGHIHEPRCTAVVAAHPPRTASRGPHLRSSHQDLLARLLRINYAPLQTAILVAARNTGECSASVHPLRADDAPAHCSDAASVHSRHSGNTRSRAMRWRPPMPLLTYTHVRSRKKNEGRAVRRDSPIRAAPSARARADAPSAEHAYLPLCATRPTPRRRAPMSAWRPGRSRQQKRARASNGSTSATPRRASRAASARKGILLWIFFPPLRSGAAANRTGADPRKSSIGGPDLG